MEILRPANRDAQTRPSAFCAEIRFGLGLNCRAMCPWPQVGECIGGLGKDGLHMALDLAGNWRTAEPLPHPLAIFSEEGPAHAVGGLVAAHILIGLEVLQRRPALTVIFLVMRQSSWR